MILFIPLIAGCASSRSSSVYQPDDDIPQISEYNLVWHDEFNKGSKPDSSIWSYEHGFVRNNELQWYQPQNAIIKDGHLIIGGKREQVKNKFYDSSTKDWRKNRAYAAYTSASVNTRGSKWFKYGIFEIRARIDTAKGLWPAIWTLGVDGRWPAKGEVDLMEFYRYQDEQTLLANVAWAGDKMRAIWNSKKIPFNHFLEKDPDWPLKFHVWKMDWTEDFIKLYVDGELLNEVNLDETHNADGFNPFHQPHYILLNLAIGGNGGDPSGTSFPKTYEVDYVRIYQKKD